MSEQLDNITRAIQQAYKSGDIASAKQFIAIHEAMTAEEVETTRVQRGAFAAHNPAQGTAIEQLGDVAMDATSSITDVAGNMMNDLGELGGQFMDNRTSGLPVEGMPPEGPESLKQFTGYALAETVIPAFGELVMTGLKTFGGAVAAATPDHIEKPVVEAAKGQWFDIINSEAGEMVSEGVEAVLKGPEWYRVWKQENPEGARDVEAQLNIAAFMAPVPKTKTWKEDDSLLEKAGSALVASGVKQSEKRRRSNISDMFTPVNETHAKKATNGGGVFTMDDGVHREYAPSQREQDIYDEVHKIPEVKRGMPFLTTRGHIWKAQEKLRMSTAARVKELGNPKIDSVELGKELGDTMDALFDSDDFKAISGNEKVGLATVDWIQSRIAKSDGTTLGLLQVRRDFDAWVKNVEKGALDPTASNSRGQVVRKLREYLNDKVEQAVPDAEVKKSLNRQSMLYQAENLIEPKLETESQTAWVRLSKKIKDADISIPHTPVGILTTMSIATNIAAHKWLPMAAFGTGAVAAGALSYQFMRSAAGKKATGQLIRQAGKLIRKTTDPVLKNQYRADRAVLLAMLSEEQRKEQSNEEK